MMIEMETGKNTKDTRKTLGDVWFDDGGHQATDNKSEVIVVFIHHNGTRGIMKRHFTTWNICSEGCILGLFYTNVLI